MKRRKRTMWRMTGMMLALLLFLSAGALAAGGGTVYCTARELYQEVQEALEAGNGDGTLTLQTQRGPITFRVNMPDVDTVPVLRVACATQEDFPEEGPEGTQIKAYTWWSEEDGWLVNMGRQEEVIGREIRGHSMRLRSEDADHIPEGSPFDHDQALQFFEDWLDAYAVPRGWDFRTVDHAVANSRSYRAVDHGQGFVPIMDEPVQEVGHETGFYEICFRQYLHGIPYWSDAASLNVSKRVGCVHPWGEANGWLLSPDHYQFWMVPAVENAVLAEDIPLAPFFKILETLEKTSAPVGDRLMFGYRLRYDPYDPATSSIVIPVWVFTTGYFNLDQLYINAQTGEVTDPRTDESFWLEWVR